MKIIRYVVVATILIIVLAIVSIAVAKRYQASPDDSPTALLIPQPSLPPAPIIPQYTQLQEAILQDTIAIKLINSSFLHNAHRNYYGNTAPSRLDIIWKHYLGAGKTQLGIEQVIWKGAGWTGQPLLVAEGNKKYIIQGAYDHHLKKIDAQTGKLFWQYKFDDVIKGTGSIWLNPAATDLENSCIILQGSRAGKSIYSSYVPSYRAISYFTGKELWRMNSSKTDCYSRDVDASCLLLHDTAYIGLENGIFTIFDPNPVRADTQQGMLQPYIYKNTDTLYRASDKLLHGGNLVTEASPTLLGNRIYIASGSGHVWGYNLQTRQIEWDYFVGSDIDGTPVVTADGCLLISIEKQYIKGNGGILKLDPRKAPSKALEWFFPTGSVNFSTWQGGVVGSAATNALYPVRGVPDMAVFTAIDGFMYVVATTEQDTNSAVLFDDTTLVPTPHLLFKYRTGPAIATPLLVDDKIIVPTYSGTYLFEYNNQLQFKLLQKIDIRAESTPFVDDGRIYLPSRNGYLYCLGDTSSLSPPIQ